MDKTGKFDLEKYPIHLGLNAKATVQDEFTGAVDWYERYGAQNAADGAEGRLVSLHSFSSPWGTWEMHPEGEELVVCISGKMTLIQEIDGKHQRVELLPGEAIVNPRGVWHTADVDDKASALFITAGMGTQVRPRN